MELKIEQINANRFELEKEYAVIKSYLLHKINRMEEIEHEIEKIDEEDEKLTVMVSIFGRMTPVELSFNQVKR